MLTTFQSTEQYAIFSEAIRLVGFESIKDAFLSMVDSSTDFDASQKLAIRLAGEKLRTYPDSQPMVHDGPLMGTLFLAWEDIGADGTTALLPEQREGILDGIIAVCQQIIQAEVTRLSALATATPTLPQGWNA